ncbi:uncharacterized protein LOC110096276 [Dendrobium catenatum]|uniref:uncharacterized protein LOC110096276 n=1 Tax=Dendrobium catenatum TaxID=906689 RepID=UPI0009F3C1CE|nr:uncharacterized protein LOC110096276 [Dendrobium catenatum]
MLFYTGIFYMRQTKGFENDNNPNHVCQLKIAIYGLKQAPRQWFNTFSTYLYTLGFAHGKADSSLFVLHNDNTYIAIYVDDILLTGNNSSMIATIISQLNTRFSMKHLDLANSFLGLQNKTNHNSYFLSQTNYAASILKLAGINNTKSLSNPLCTKVPDIIPTSQLLTDPKIYRQITRSLQYLTLTRPDISYAVNLLCQNMHNPSSYHFYLLHRLLRYIYGTLSFGIPILPGDKDTRKSTSSYCTFLGHTLISWTVKKQHMIARSSTEAEYRAIALALTDIIWM